MQTNTLAWRLGFLVTLGLLASPALSQSGSRPGGGGGRRAGTGSFQGLGHLPNGIGSEAWAVSGDGSTVVGRDYVPRTDLPYPANGPRAWRWTSTGGMEALGTLGGAESDAADVSADGSVVVGSAATSDGHHAAFLWQSGMMTELALFAPPGTGTAAHGVSADGSVQVGQRAASTSGGGLVAFRRIPGGDVQALGDLGGNYSSALDVSPDGTIVVGVARNSAAAQRAFRWTAPGGLQDLGTLGGADSIARAVSGSGSVVVGESRNRRRFWHAFRWAGGRMRDLRTLGGAMSAAQDVSSDGNVVVGHSQYDRGNATRAFHWTHRSGMRDLRRTLLARGATAVRNWTLLSATGVSADGTVIVGVGVNADGKREAYRAVLSR